ncbi:MAG: cysteine desulfurase NifS [Euryarchaeota archaeon]|nr:cysteine desulfurase NifS [Euryarchaeota archaeon]
MKTIYLDHAATTPVDPQVIETMIPYFSTYFGNASSLHSYGRDAYDALEESRKQVAELIKARKQEIIFTAGGTESDNIAIKGVAYQNKQKRQTKGPHIITSTIEHAAVLEVCKHLQTQGYKIEYLPVDTEGIVNTTELENTISKDTFLITIMTANNEIGTIQPIEKIGRIAHDHDVLFHTDAVQAIGKMNLDMAKNKVDLLSISSHKIYGPKGVGALYIREGVRIEPLIHGGGHERGLRSSTENIPGITGLGKACELAAQRMEKDTIYLKKLRDQLIKGLLEIEESFLNGHPTKRLVNNAHFRFTGIEGESLVLGLNDKGVAAATGSACSSKKLQSSHVLTAIGIDPIHAHGSLRLTLGRENTADEIAYVIKVLPEIVDHLRTMSPLWNR